MTGSAPVVLLHGWSLDSRVWGGVRHRLGTEMATFAPDLPGHNGAPIDLRHRTLDEFHDLAVTSFAGWCRQHDLAGAPMVAWAWGSQVLVDAVARDLVAPRSVALVSFAAPFQTPDSYGAVLRDWPAYARALVRMMTAKPMSAAMESWLAGAMAASAIPAIAGVQRVAWVPPDHRFRLPPDSIAILGAADRLNPARLAVPLLESWGVSATIMDDVGHVPFVEDRAGFDAVISDWLGRIAH